jgi:hypothetical protein
MTMKRTLGALGLAIALCASGCVLEPEKKDAGRFREAIPQTEAVELSGPETAQGSSNTQSYAGLSSAQASDESWANGPWAYWYGFTRSVRQGVNQVTASVLGGVWIIVHTQPTRVSDTEAVWGPWTDALEPATYRFRIEEVARDEYDYTLEGRPKTSDREADYRAVLKGKGWAKGHPKHGDGFFMIDLDVARELDPFNVDADETGMIEITHDLPPDITDNLFSNPKTVTAKVTPSKSESWFEVTTTSKEDGTGTLVVGALADADDSNATQLETIGIASQWTAQGAGRADITISGGDVPADPGTVSAVECWDTTFARVYYGDSINYEPTDGELSACAFSAPATP